MLLPPVPCHRPGPSYWTGEATANRDWNRRPNAAEIAALQSMIDKAMPPVGDDPSALLGMTSADFCVGAFEALLREVEFELRHGKGFAVISRATRAPMDVHRNVDRVPEYRLSSRCAAT